MEMTCTICQASLTPILKLIRLEIGSVETFFIKKTDLVWRAYLCARADEACIYGASCIVRESNLVQTRDYTYFLTFQGEITRTALKIRIITLGWCFGMLDRLRSGIKNLVSLTVSFPSLRISIVMLSIKL